MKGNDHIGDTPLFHGPMIMGVPGIYIDFHQGISLISVGLYEPGSKLLVLGMAISPLIGNPYNGAL